MAAHTDTTSSNRNPAAAAVPMVLVVTLALQNAVPPFATDTYTPAFPQVTSDLHTSAAHVGLTLTAFFAGMGLGQLVGGPLSDQVGRRRPVLAGGLLCMLGAVGCALSPSIGWLVAARVLQGLGGGMASVVGRAVLTDLARGPALARVMSIMMALGGLAPMLAPVLGGAVLTAGGTWRTVFWTLVGFGALMVVMAALFIPESLPPEQRHRGGASVLASGLVQVVRAPAFLGYVLVGAFSQFTMMAYVANAAYVLQAQKGMRPLSYSIFFASTALAQVLLSLLNARLVTSIAPRRMIRFGMLQAAVGVALITVCVLALHTPLVGICVGFLVLMSAQAFIFGNASSLAMGQAAGVAGSASAVMGVVQALGTSLSAPLASSGGAATARPMVWVMLVGVAGAWTLFLTLARPRAASATS